MQIIDSRLVDEPDITLIACAAPEMVGALFPAIEDGLVLALIIGASERERVLGRVDKEDSQISS